MHRVRTLQCLYRFSKSGNLLSAKILPPYRKKCNPRTPATTLTPDQINGLNDSYLPKRNILIERSDPEEGASPEWIIHSTVIRTKNAIDPATAVNHTALETIIPKMADILTGKILSALHKKYMCK